MWRPWFNSWVRKIRWRKVRLPNPVFLGFPCGSAGKESACNVGDLGSIPGLGRSPGEGKGYPLQYSDLENSMGGIVHGITKSRTRLSDFHSLTHVYFKPAPAILGSIPNPAAKVTPRTDQVCIPREGEKQQTSKQINEHFRAMK